MRELESDDAVELLENLPEESQEEILERIPAPERRLIERALLYPENSAGRRMQTEFIAVPPDWTVGQTIDYMRETPDLPDRFYELYTVDEAQKLRGAVPLDALLRARRPVPIAELMDEERRRVLATDDQEEVARLFGKYNLVAAPVVDQDDRLVGVITVDDVVDVIEEEAEEDIRALGGVTHDEELSDTVWTIAKGRFPWLFVNMLTACLSAFVISRFEDAIEKMVALAVLMPVVASMGGNAGTQTMTVAVRALATRELHRGNALRVLTARADGRRAERARVRDHPRCDGGSGLQDREPRRGDRARDGDSADLRGPGRPGHPADAEPAGRRSGCFVRTIRHDDHRRGRIPVFPRHRNVVVRVAIGAVKPRLTISLQHAGIRRHPMRRLRLKADGRIVELHDGNEAPLVPVLPPGADLSAPALDVRALRKPLAAHAGRIRRTSRRAAGDHPQLGAGQARAARDQRVRC